MRLVHYRQPSFRSPAVAWSDFDAEIERLFSSAFGGLNNTFTGVPVDVHADNENVYVRAELPGVKRDQVDLEFVDGVLGLSVQSEKTETSAPQTLYKRTLAIPADVVGEKINATLQDGILTVTLPKAEEVKPRKIAINVN